MNLMKELENLAYVLPNEEKNLSNLSPFLQQAISCSDSSLIKNTLSKNNPYSDMTQVTSLENYD